VCWKPAFCAHRVWHYSSFYQEVQCSLCYYQDGRFPWTTRLHQILFQVRENCYRMLWNLKTAFGEQAMGRSQTFQWFSRFKASRTSIDDDECSGQPVSSSTPEMTDRVRQIIREDRRHTIDEVSMLVGISHGTCHKILKIWRCDVSHQSSCPGSGVATKNSNDLTFAWTSKKMLLMTPAFFQM